MTNTFRSSLKLWYRELTDGHIYYMLQVLEHIIQIISSSKLSKHHVVAEKVHNDHSLLTPSLTTDPKLDHWPQAWPSTRQSCRAIRNIFTFRTGKKAGQNTKFVFNELWAAGCLLLEKYKNLFVKGRKHHCKDVDWLIKACVVLADFFFFFLHDDVILIGHTPKVIFVFLESWN